MRSRGLENATLVRWALLMWQVMLLTGHVNRAGGVPHLQGAAAGPLREQQCCVCSHTHQRTLTHEILVLGTAEGGHRPTACGSPACWVPATRLVRLGLPPFSLPCCRDLFYFSSGFCLAGVED